jgi:aprataxin and PNK-like factor
MTHNFVFVDYMSQIHNNPIYYKHVGDQDYKTLFKDESTILKHCDKFSFLPMPNTEYEVRIEDQNSTGNFRIRQVGEINENLVNGSMSTSMSQIFGTEQNVPDTTNDYHNDPNRTPSPENLVPPASFLQNERKRSSENQESNESPAKRSKSETSEATASSSTSTTTLNVTPVKIKPDPDSTTIQQNPSTSTGIRITKIKQEPDASKMPKVKIEPPSRPSCEFGIRCYRQTPDHRRNFAHPNDSDYRRPSYPNAPPGTPPCP